MPKDDKYAIYIVYLWSILDMKMCAILKNVINIAFTLAFYGPYFYINISIMI